MSALFLLLAAHVVQAVNTATKGPVATLHVLTPDVFNKPALVEEAIHFEQHVGPAKIQHHGYEKPELMNPDGTKAFSIDDLKNAEDIVAHATDEDGQEGEFSTEAKRDAIKDIKKAIMQLVTDTTTTKSQALKQQEAISLLVRNQKILNMNLAQVRASANDMTTLNSKNLQQLGAMLQQMDIQHAEEARIDGVMRGSGDTDAKQGEMIAEILEAIKVLEARLESATTQVGSKVGQASKRIDQLWTWSYAATDRINSNTNSLHELVHEVTSVDNKQYRTSESLIDLMNRYNAAQIQKKVNEQEAKMAALHAADAAAAADADAAAAATNPSTTPTGF